MRTTLSTALALVLAAGISAPAIAAQKQSTLSVKVVAVMPTECTFETPAVAVHLTNEAPTFRQDIYYTCNFASPLLVYASTDNGVLVDEQTGAKAAYNFNFDALMLAGPDSWGPAENYGPQGNDRNRPFYGLTASTAPGERTTVKLGVHLRDQLKVAGLYSDVVTITVAP